MHQMISERGEELARICARHSVKRLELFGSAATGDFDDKTSDLDFLVEFISCSPQEHYDRYFGLVEDLEALFARHVDLVEARALRNPYFIREVEESRERIYAA